MGDTDKVKAPMPIEDELGLDLDLDAFRSHIDILDAEILETLCERFKVCREVAEFKGRNGVAVMQPARVEEVKERCAEIGVSLGLRPEFVRALYSLIIEEVCVMEEGHIAARAASATGK